MTSMASNGDSREDLNHLTLEAGVIAFLWGSMIWDIPFQAALRPLEVTLLLVVTVSECIIILSSSLHRPAMISTLVGLNLGTLPPLLSCIAETGPIYLVLYAPMQFVLLKFARLHARQARSEALLQFRASSLTRRLAQTNTALVDAVDRLRWQADHDALTLLRNRHAFGDEVDRLFSTGGGEARFAVLLLDLDHFKRINDRFGHDVGDRVLRASGRILGDWEGEGPNRVTARWGGEEFIAVFEVRNGEDVRSSVGDLHGRFSDEIRGGDWPEGLKVTASIGVGAVGLDGTLADAVKRADHALYAAKASGRNCWRAAA